MANKDSCPMCGYTEGHSKQCSFPSIKDRNISAEELQKRTELLKRKFLNKGEKK